MDERGGEFAAIDRFVAHFPAGGPGVRIGPGDDAALLTPTRGQLLCATTDALLDGVHFGPRFRPEEIGHKALAVNLSDLAAMGATPRWFLCALGLPAQVSRARLDGIARGMAALAQRVGCGLVGGNLTRASRLSLTITALGEVDPRRALRRAGLHPGDVLAVTGTLGGAAAGLRALRAGRREGAARQLRPTPQVAAGRAALGLARAAIDVSDGLAQDVGHLGRASGCGVTLWEEALPLARGASRKDALSGGEDYELVFGVEEARLAALTRRLAALGVPLTPIGRARRGLGVDLARREGAKATALHAPGFLHR